MRNIRFLKTRFSILEKNNLGGTLPPELGQLLSLSVLDLYVNRITGGIPIELANTNLTLLDFEINNFNGPLFFPEMLNLAPTLISWRGSDNSFSGSIPTWIGQMTNLQQIWAEDNGLTGTIPTEITNLSLVRTLPIFSIVFPEYILCVR
jgi:Leucine-rich repeat (LRR) protein